MLNLVGIEVKLSMTSRK